MSVNVQIILIPVAYVQAYRTENFLLTGDIIFFLLRIRR
jgi:hypothetical protein